MNSKDDIRKGLSELMKTPKPEPAPPEKSPQISQASRAKKVKIFSALSMVVGISIVMTPWGGLGTLLLFGGLIGFVVGRFME